METLGRAATLFGSNAFSTRVGQQIELATDSSLPSEDWALILEICDIINGTEEGPKDAIKAIRKRLSNQKNFKSIIYTLTVCEACVKNCGPRFHKYVGSKEFLTDFTKLLGQKGQPSQSPQVVQEKVLSLIQSWSDAFRNAPDLQGIKACYDNLKAQGYEFPAQDLDKLSPIFTPNATVLPPAPPPQTNVPQTAQFPQFLPTNIQQPPQYQEASIPQRLVSQPPPKPQGPINPTVEQLGKLRSELDIVESNAQVLSEMLIQLHPGKEEQEDLELLEELNATCREMQKRVQELLGRMSNEEVTGVLLRVNDNLNNLFLRYDRYDRSRKGITGQLTNSEDVTGGPQTGEIAVASTLPIENLIDFNLEEPEPPKSLPKEDNEDLDDEFAEFAQSRTISKSPERHEGSTYNDNIVGVPSDGSLSDVLSARSPYPYESIGVAGNEQSIGMTGTYQPIEMTGTYQPIEMTGTYQPIEMTGTYQPIEMTGTYQPIEMTGNVQSQFETEQGNTSEESLRETTPSHAVQSNETANPMTSSEFDKFLSDRAMLGSQGLDSSPPPSSSPQQLGLTLVPQNVQMMNKTAEQMHGL